MSIAITGASGKLGRLIMKQLKLLVPAEQIIACVRDIEAGKDLAAQGIEVRYCDYDRPDSIEQALAGVSRLLLISSPNPDDIVRLRQHVHVVEVAKKLAVSHVLYTSFAFPENSDIPLTHLHLATEHAIRAAGIPYTFLRNGLYMDFLEALNLKNAIADGAFKVLPGTWRFNAVARDDLAVATAAVLAGEGHHNKTYELVAPVSWTFGEIASILSELSGIPIYLREDDEIRHWIYGFLSKIDTVSTSYDLERLMSLAGRPLTPLKENIRSYLKM
ncbi:NmrA family NAD(P)-binding protein [Paenibacillus sp. GCM10012307]|uniref:NmrA family NAD(P)-binding protein n=1 Tax=Paenibacillus roseus TaxID=2798579 RepID=A0A934MNE1_9BACL|nr:NmrA family NAD(P)-binding protein [Paenibacillus roseus]MBJ6359753.1 NmrA family NAD(P)-binding protein [Paenibacillus roseus]